MSQYNGYDRNRVSEVLFTYSNKINPAFCFGRKKDATTGIPESFTLAFFLNCSDSEIEYINSFVEDEEELLLSFCHKKPGKDYYEELSWDDMKSFDFKNHSWKVNKSSAPTWDELRDMSQKIISIYFD